MTNQTQLSALLAIERDRVAAMIDADFLHSQCPIDVTAMAVASDPRLTLIQGPAHDVMRVVGLLADKGEACLRGVLSDDQVEEVNAATAYVELYTGNGTRKQPPQWAVDHEGQFDTELISRRARAMVSMFQR